MVELQRYEFEIKGLHCAQCAAKIQSEINRVEGIGDATVDFALSKISFSAGAHAEKEIRKVSYIISSIEKGAVLVTSKETKDQRKSNSISLAAAGLVYISALVAPEGVLKLSLFLVSYILASYRVYIASAKNIIRGQIFDENFLMAIATIGALLIGEYPEGVAVMLFYDVGELLQEIAVHKSRKSIRSLASLYPDEATLKTPEGEKRIPSVEVREGDILALKPGEKVCVDSVVMEGKGYMDTQAVTGEPVPRLVQKGDEIFAGFINTEDELLVKAVKKLKDSAAAKIIRLTEEAAEKKSSTETAISRFAKVYTPVVTLFAALLMVLPPLFGLGDFKTWIYRGLVFLAASCPCALVLSVPLAYFGGIGRASKDGILVKGGTSLESLAKAKAFVFDKTGTLTEGNFEVVEISAQNCFKKEEVLQLAAAAEKVSAHPIAKSILRMAADIPDAKEGKEVSGFGVSALVNGREILAGSKSWLERYGIRAADPQGMGSIVHVAAGGVYAGTIRVSDKVKENAKETVAALKKLGVKKVYLFTGDNEQGALAIARETGVDSYMHSMQPQEKAEKLEELKKSYNTVFVGDGINDAPSIASADTGIALGKARDITLEAADVVVIGEDTAAIPKAYGIAKMTRYIARQNIIGSIGVKAVVLILGAAGLATIWAAVIADTALALLAVANSLRIVVWRQKH